MQDVVLVDADAPADAPGRASWRGRADPDDPAGGADAAALGSAERPASAWELRVRRWWPVAVGGMLVVVLATTVAADRRDAARLAALRAVPGILAPVEGDLAEVWRAEDLLWLGPREVDGRLIGSAGYRDGSVDVVAVDPETGTTAWTALARGPGTVAGWIQCALPKGLVVTCVVVDEVIITAESTAGYAYSPAKSRLFVVDAATGAVLADRPIEASSVVAALDDDLVISHVDANGYLVVRRTDARGAVDRWKVTSPAPLPLDDTKQRRARLTVTDGAVVLEAGSTWVLSGQGDLLASWTPGATTELGRRAEVLPGPLLAEPVDGVRSLARTRIRDLGSGRSFVAAGKPVDVELTDGTLPGLVLLRSMDRNQLLAYDLTSGVPRWDLAGVADEAIVVGGYVIRAENGQLQAIEGSTGSTLWSTPVDRVTRGPLVTDGRLVMLTRRSADGEVVLAAYGLDDGRLRWQTETGGNLDLTTISGRLYGWSGHALIALRAE